MKTNYVPRDFALVFGILISFLSMGMAVDVLSQSKSVNALVDRLLATENYKGSRLPPRARIARAIAKDTSISPKIRVDVLTTILRHELEYPCPVTHFIHGGYATPTVYIQKQYVFGLEDVGAKAIPHLRKRLEQLKVSVQSASRSLGNRQNVNVAEMQYTLLALGSLGEKEVFLDVLALFKAEDSNGILRKKAAVALGKLKNKAAIPDLKRALKDDFHVSYRTCVSDKPQTIYPVREAAFGALRALEVEVVFEGIVDGIRIYRVVR